MSERLSKTPWHLESYRSFLDEGLPTLLASRIPLTGYDVVYGNSSVRVTAWVGNNKMTPAKATYTLLMPDERGLFTVNDDPVVVIPEATSVYLAQASILCVGEQLLKMVDAKLTTAPSDLCWDENLLRAWVGLDTWVDDFLAEKGQKLDTTTWSATATHLRRLIITDTEGLSRTTVTPDHWGRVCPLDTPEGPRCGTVVTVAMGATITKGKLIGTSVSVDDDPCAYLSPAASLIPFLQFSEPARTLMGISFTRQFKTPDTYEAALVVTGYEPECGGAWTGRNLLTAFMSLGGNTAEDAIVISETARKSLSHSNGVLPEVGDKLTNRHGSKGVISAILPDEQMPKMSDGKPVDLVFSFIGMHTRQNHSQVLEAVAGRVAKLMGKPYVAPTLTSTPQKTLDTLTNALQEYGLGNAGMETLEFDGHFTQSPVTTGYVYWGVSNHLANQAFALRPMVQGEMEYAALKSIGAHNLIHEHFCTRSADSMTAEELTELIVRGELSQSEPSSPFLAKLNEQLNVVGISLRLGTTPYGRRELKFENTPVCDSFISLPKPIDHPWIPGVKLTSLGRVQGVQELDALIAAVQRYEGMVKAGIPETILSKAELEIASLAQTCLTTLDMVALPKLLRLSGRSHFSGKSVIVPGPDLKPDQIGIPEEMAQSFYGPLAKHTGAASVDEVMVGSYLLLNRAPTLSPTNIVALRPVKVSGKAIHIHPLLCKWLDGDFDGDQVAVFLPITEAGQREAMSLLSIEAHVRRDNSLLTPLMPSNEALWGLAYGFADGKDERVRDFASSLGVHADEFNHMMNALEKALLATMTNDNTSAMEHLGSLWNLGWTIASEAGASMPPLVPETTGPITGIEDDIIARWDTESNPLFAQLIAVRSGARGSARQLAEFVSSIAPGLATEELRQRCMRTWVRFVELQEDWDRAAKSASPRSQFPYPSQSVLNRAMRSPSPGVVCGRAAAYGESDPLTDVDACHFVGILPE